MLDVFGLFVFLYMRKEGLSLGILNSCLSLCVENVTVKCIDEKAPPVSRRGFFMTHLSRSKAIRRDRP